MIRHNVIATGPNDPTKQISVNAWNSDHVIENEITLPVMAAAPVPAADKLNVYAEKIAGRVSLSQRGPSGLDTILQAHLGRNKTALWMPPGGSTAAPAVIGMNALTTLGTATARAMAATNLLTRMTRLGYVSAATAASLAGARENIAKYTTGAGGNLGGFFALYRFAPSDAAAVAGARMFVGLSANTAAPTNVEPTTQVNSIGVAQLSTSNNLYFMSNGATATGTPVDLGSNFPANGSTAVYELALFAPPPGGEVHWQVTRLDTDQKASGTLTSNIPANTVLLCHQLWRCNNATLLAVGLDICGIYIETDY